MFENNITLDLNANLQSSPATDSFLDGSTPPSFSNGLQPNEYSSPKSSFYSGKITQQKYNELFHSVELYLDNSGTFDGKPETRFHINPASVLNLTIIDTFQDWIVDGSLTFLYLPEDVMPINTGGQNIQTTTKGSSQESPASLKSYQFRNDGFDLLRIMIHPTNNSKEADTGSFLPNVGDNPRWYLSYLFSIYDVEDIENVAGNQGVGSTYMKCLKLYFKDVRAQILQTTNLEYSTATSKDYTPNFSSGLANEGVLYVGDAMLEIFNKAVGDLQLGGCLEFLQLEGPNWDKGINEIFYTSPAEYNALEDLQYLMSSHVSSTQLKNSNVYDLSIMHTERSQSPTLLEPICVSPLTEFFDKALNGTEAGELQLEHFFVTSHTDEVPNIQKSDKAPFSNASDRDLKTAKYGQIISYSFVDMSPEINSKLFSWTPVYSVDIGNRVFAAEFMQNTPENARKLIAESYIDKLFKDNSAGTNQSEKLFLGTIHKSKQKANVFPTFSLNGDNEITRQRNGIHQLIYTGLFQNACICFKTLGLTLRESGTFIAIDRTDGSNDDDYNNKLYGQWLVVKVDHIFEAGAYVNVIYAIKIHRYKPKSTDFPESI